MIVPTSPPNTSSQLHVIDREIEDEGPKVSYSFDQANFGDDTVLLVENTLFRVPSAILERSETFSAKYLSPTMKNSGPRSAGEMQVGRLDGYLAADFRQFLRVLVPPPQTPSNDFSKDEAVSVLKLATELDFPRVRWRAIEELGQHVLQDPVFQLITAKKYDVHQWLVPSLKAIMGTKADLDLPHIISRLSCALEKTVMQDLGPRLASLRRSCLNLLARYPATVLDFTDAICTVFACNPDGQPVERFEDRPSAVGTPDPTTTASLHDDARSSRTAPSLATLSSSASTNNASTNNASTNNASTNNASTNNASTTVKPPISPSTTVPKTHVTRTSIVLNITLQSPAPTSQSCTGEQSTASISKYAAETIETGTPFSPPPSPSPRIEVEVQNGRCTCTEYKLRRAADYNRKANTHLTNVSEADRAAAKRRAVRAAARERAVVIQIAKDEVYAAAIAFKSAQVRAHPLCKRADADQAYLKKLKQTTSQYWFGRFRLNGAELLAEVSAERAKPVLAALSRAEDNYAAAQWKLKELMK